MHLDLRNIMTHLITILSLILLNRIIAKILEAFVESKFEDTEGRKTKLETISRLLSSVVKFIIYFIIVLNILDMLGFNTRSLIATAGIGGVAIAFGAQNLVKDVISGIFIIANDTYRVGDFITTSSISGAVEDIGVRQTKLRDYDGSLHIIPNSEITKVKNSTTDYQRADIVINFSYDTKIEDIEDIIDIVSKRLKEEEDLKDVFYEELSFVGVESLNDFSFSVKATSLVEGGTQFSVKRRANRFIKEEMEKRSIHANDLARRNL